MAKNHNPTQTTIGSYLLDRLHHYGIAHIFAIPGDYVLKFNKLIEEREDIQFINTTRENTAGYMADAYARLRGLGVACITYGVGVNIVNALSQAFVESSPLVVISGAAGTEDYLKGVKLHHQINKSLTDPADVTQLSIFKHVTIAQAVLDDPSTAASLIDETLAKCVEKKKPIYIEIPRNMVDCCISEPNAQPILKKEKTITNSLDQAYKTISDIIHTCQKPVLWVGHEIQRYNLAKPVLAFAEKYQIPIVSSLLGKTVIDEHHPLFVGVYMGKMSRSEIDSFMESRDCVFMLGLMLTDVDTGIFTAKLDHEHIIIANKETLKVDGHSFAGTDLCTFTEQLHEIECKKSFKDTLPSSIKTKPEPFKAKPHAKTTTKRIFECIQHHLEPNNIVFADVGDSMFASAELILPQNSYLACAHFGSLGFATPGCIGAQIAAPEKRVIAIVGDGAFQITATELSTAVRYHIDPIVIILNNHGYGTERPLLEGSYNDIQNWNYSELPKVLGGGIGIKVTTEEDFDKALTTALAKRGAFYLIEVELDKTDFSPALRRFGEIQSQK